MTTSSWATVIDHTSDAGFRAWGSELNGKLAAAGLVQTADTGQINWTTVTRPAANTAAGYEIWRFADSSLYFKLEYGTGAATPTPQMWITAGPGSSGAGAITGQTSTRATIGHSGTDNGTHSVVTARTSYLCVTADYVGLCWKTQGNVNAQAFATFVIQKYNDSTGAAVSTGFNVHFGPSSGAAGQLITSQSVRTASTAKAWTAGSSFAMMPHGMSDSVVGADNQVFPHMVPTPRVIVLKHTFTVFDSEAVLGTTFTATPVGSTAHTYLSLGGQAGYTTIVPSLANALCILWE